MEECRFYLFGPPHLTRNGLAVVLPRRKQWGLLAYLLVTRQPHERDALAALLWPTHNQEHARANLRRELARLRSLLPVLLSSGHTAIAVQPAADVWVDVWAFEQHLAAVKAHHHASDDLCAPCLDHLRAARALYVDDLLAGCTLRDSPDFEEWHFFQQETLRSQLLALLSRLAQMEMAGVEPSQAIAPLRARLALDPLHEESHRRLIWLYAQTGQRTAALRQFQKCQDVLASELGVAPAPATLALYRQIAQVDAAAQDASGGQPGGGQQSGISSPPAPTPARRFLDRERHLTQLNAHLDAACRGCGRVVFVTGEAGAGKTALLGHFAQQALTSRTDLIVAGGCGTAQYGAGAPLLPFRDLFAMLTCDFECEWMAGMPAGEQMKRLRALFPRVVQVLIQVGPHLVNSLITGDRLLARAAEIYLDGKADYEELRALVTSRHEWSAVADAHDDLILPEVGAVLHALAEQHPLLLLLDNLHWADALSFDLLFHLGKRVGAQPILIVGAYRPSEIAPDGSRSHTARLPVHHPLIPLTHEFARDFGAIQVDLDAVAPPEEIAWLDALLDAESCALSPAARNALFAQTHGYPLFTIELLQFWRDQGWLRRNAAGDWVEAEGPDLSAVPPKAAAAIQRRLDRLSEAAARLLAVASVEGEIFTVPALAAVQGWSERRTLELVATELHHDHHLVTEVATGNADLPIRYQFTNPMICTYLYNQLDQGERRLLHAALAQALNTLT